MNKQEKLEYNFKRTFKPVCGCCSSENIYIVLCQNCYSKRQTIEKARKKYFGEEQPKPTPDRPHPWEDDEDEPTPDDNPTEPGEDPEDTEEKIICVNQQES